MLHVVVCNECFMVAAMFSLHGFFGDGVHHLRRASFTTRSAHRQGQLPRLAAALSDKQGNAAAPMCQSLLIA